MTKRTPSSFTLKLVTYFLLLSLLPAAAALWGFSSVARESEARRVDARLQSGLRAALVAYGERLSAASRSANTLASDHSFQRALADANDTIIRSALLEAPDVRVESSRLNVGTKAPFAAETPMLVVSPTDNKDVGTVFASVAFDQELLNHLHRRSGLDARETIVVVRNGRIVVAPNWLRGRLALEPGRTATVSIGGDRYRALVAARAKDSALVLAALAPQSEIDAASGELLRRLFLGVLATLLLIALVAYFEGRSIVRAVSRIAVAANAISRGKLDERVPVKGRDELARLGSAFNQMADQLQVRLDELESERQRLRDALSRFGDALAATHHPEQLLRVIVETAVEATEAHGGMLIGSDGSVVEVGVAGSGPDQLEIPLFAGKVGFGTLFLFGRNFDDDARMTAVSLVSQSVMALENARLHRIVERQALADGLTGLANRRHCEDVLATELARADRFGGPLAVVLADIDDFKAVNDVHGHPVGDTVLCEFSRLLEASVRDVDVAGRWGGEEFVLVLPGTDAVGAVRLAERIRAHLEESTLLTPEGVPIRITSSFGVASRDDGSTVEELVAAADSALYEAKRAGKNRVGRASEAVGDRP